MADLEGPRLTELMTYLIDRGEQGCVEDIFPYLDKAFVGILTPNRLMAINTLRSLLQQKLIPPKSFNHKFVEGLLLSMENSEKVIAKAWLDILFDVTELAPIHVVKTSILPLAVSMGQLSESVDSRVASSQLLGKMAARFDSTEIDKEIVPLVHSLCQDVASEVRTSMCRQLPVITKGLSSDAVLLPLIVELAIDEESTVRLAAIQAIADLLPHLKQDVIKDIVIPLFKRICEEASLSQDDSMCIIAKNYAHFCLGIEFAISSSDKVYFLRFFKQLAKAGLNAGESKRQVDSKLECRYQCAYFFPSMVSFSGVQLFEELLYPTYVALASDPFHGIRRSIAAGIHEVMRLLGSKCVQLRAQLIALLNDTNIDVLQAIVPNISDALEQIARTETLIDDVASQQLARALASCERVLHQSHNWRAHAAILAQLECAPRVLPTDIAQNTLSSILVERVQNARPMPCRLAAARTLLILWRHTVRADQRTQLRDRILTEICNNRSCHCRLLFVKMCGMALDIFSSHYFKEHFYLPLLSRARDPIPNIRLLVCRLLPRLKMLLQLPQDSAKLALLEDAVHQLATSKPDPDVSAELLAVRSQLDRITVRTDLSSVGLLPRSLTKAEEDDDARYEEEFKIAQAENRSRKLVTVNMKTLGQGTKPSLIAIPPVEISKRTPFQVTPEPRRSSDTSTIFNHLTSALNDCTLSNRSPGLSKSCTSINSAFPTLREDEFYVDAGVSLKMVRVGMSLSNIPTVRDIFGVGSLGTKTSSTSISTLSTYSSTRSSSPKLRLTPRAHSSISLPASSSHITKASSLPITKSTSATKRYSQVLVVESKTVPDLKVILGDKKSSPVNRNSKISVTVNNKPLGKPVTKNTSVTVLNRRQASMSSVSTDRRRVALSSIGVRPQSCIAVGSRSLSQESLRTVDGTRSPRLSQIPRGAVSCHSSPGNSRACSPPRMSQVLPQAPALVSRLPIRRDRLSMSK